MQSLCSLIYTSEMVKGQIFLSHECAHINIAIASVHVQSAATYNAHETGFKKIDPNRIFGISRITNVR